MFSLCRRFLALCAAGGAVLVAGCVDSPAAPRDAGLRLEPLLAASAPLFSMAGEESVTSALISPGGGTLTTASGHRIVFPAGAVPQPTEISIRDDGTYLGVRLEPHGLSFPAGRGPELTLKLLGADVSGYATLRVAYVDEAGEILEVLSTTREDDTVVARLRHFSGYIISGGRH